MMPPHENLRAAAPWLCLVAAIALLASPDADAPPPAREKAAAELRRDAAAAQACEGHPFTWVDPTTLVCHRELP